MSMDSSSAVTASPPLTNEDAAAFAEKVQAESAATSTGGGVPPKIHSRGVTGQLGNGDYTIEVRIETIDDQQAAAFVQT